MNTEHSGLEPAKRPRLSWLPLRWRRNDAVLRKVEGSLFIAPWVIGFLVFVAFPLVYSLYMSFNQVRITVTGVQTSWVGVQYYREILLADGGLLYDDLFPFLREALVMIPIIIVFSLMIAILLNLRFAGRAAFRVIFFLPVIFASGQIIGEFIAQGEGSLNVIASLGMDDRLARYLPDAWAGPIGKVIGSFVLVLWYSGVQILIFIAGFQTIPKTVYEAVRVDGASPWESFWKITFPGMLPFIGLNAVYTIVDLFTFPFNPVMEIVRNNMFSPTTGYGYASAMAWLYFAIVLVLLGITLWLTYRATKGRGELR